MRRRWTFVLGLVLLIAFSLSCGKSEDRTVTGTVPCLEGLPDPPLSVQANPGDGAVQLDWVIPAGVPAIRILRKEGGYPASPADTEATRLNTSAQPPFLDTGLTNGTTYYYRAWTENRCADVSTSYRDTLATPQAVLCAPPSNVSITPGVHSLTLCWTPNCATVLIRRKVGGYPSNPTDGTLVYEGSQTCDTDASLSGGVEYYYSLYSKDAQGRTSATAAHARGTAGWEYTTYSIPQLTMSEKRPTDDCGGDCEFSGHGPSVELIARLQRSGITFWVEVVKFRAVETQSDFTCVQKLSTSSWTTNSATGPSGWQFDSYVSDVSDETVSYTDTDHALDRTFGSRIVNYMDVIGDTDGDDACNTTEDDTHLHAFATRTLQVRLRR